MNNFRDKLTALINEHSKENGSNTPDFILAQYLEFCLEAFDYAVSDKEKWHGKVSEKDTVLNPTAASDGISNE